MINIRNKIQLVGPVSGIQTFETENGVLYSKFTVTTTETFFSIDGEKLTQLIHHECIAYNKEAVFIRDRILPGDNIAIEGRLIQMAVSKTSKTKTETLVCVRDLLRLH